MKLPARICIGLIIVLIFVGLAMVTPALAQQVARVGIEPGEVALNPGETTSLAVTIHGADNLYGFEIHLEFDPSAIHIVDSDAAVDGVQVAPGNIFDVGNSFLAAN